MAQPADTFSTYDAVGNREDLSDFITMISPTATPFHSGVAKVPATATLHEWQTDTLAPATDANTVIEGDQATTDASTATVRLGNYTQILDKVARVTGTQRAVNPAGRQDEMDYQVMKRTKEIRRDLESSLLANKAKVAGNDTTARVMAGIESWLATNTDLGGTGAAPTGDGTDTRTSGTDRAFAESQVKDVIASCWDEGGEPDMIMVPSNLKQDFSAFTGNSSARQNIDANTRTLSNVIDIYISDFGTMNVVPNRFMVSESCLILEMDKFAVAELRPYASWDLAKEGDTDRKQLLIECTLVSKNEKSSGIVSDLS